MIDGGAGAAGGALMGGITDASGTGALVGDVAGVIAPLYPAIKKTNETIRRLRQ